jgi:hypothetical protein
MLVQCNLPKCNTTVNALLNVDTDEVICGDCGGVITSVSKYSKLSMKTNGDIIRTKKKKAFVFPCETCETHVEATFVNSKLVGKSCQNEQNGCKINITEHMVKAIQETEKYLAKVEVHDESE